MLDIDDVLIQINQKEEIKNDLQRLSDIIDKNQSFERMEVRLFRTSKQDSVNHRLIRRLHSNILEILESNWDKLSNPSAISLSERMNYQHLCFLSGADKNEPLNKERLADWLMISFLAERAIKTDDYVENLKNYDLLTQLGITHDDEGLVKLTDFNFEILNQGIKIKDKEYIFLHQFLRRFFSARFVGIPNYLREAIRKGYVVEARIDPFKYKTGSPPRDIVEADYWSGIKYSNDLLESTDKDETYAIHGLSDFDDIRVRRLTLTYPLLQTHFRSSMMDENKRQISIEEYVPEEVEGSLKSSNFGKKYHVQKFAHLVYDQTSKTIEHFDCAIRIFEKEDYLKILDEVKSGKHTDSKIGVRHKLIKISGKVDTQFTLDTLYEFFRYNPLVIEYFSNKTFDEVCNELGIDKY